MSDSNNKQEPIRHHYIPQFILRPFCYEKDRIHYYSKDNNEVRTEYLRNVFMERDLYRDEKQFPDDPVRIEKDLASFEREASVLIDRFRNDKDIRITNKETDRLKLFLAIMSFRNYNLRDYYRDRRASDMMPSSVQLTEKLDLTMLWRRDLGYLVNCRSVSEVINHPSIDPSTKQLIDHIVNSWDGTFLTVLERRGSEDFIIGDSYPSVLAISFDPDEPIILYRIFPISPSRVLLLVTEGLGIAGRSIVKIDSALLMEPPQSKNWNNTIVPLRKIYERDVKWLNAFMIKMAGRGFIFKDPSKITLNTDNWTDDFVFRD